MFEMAHLYEDALREYDELELCYLETGAKLYACVLSVYFTVSLVCLIHENNTGEKLNNWEALDVR